MYVIISENRKEIKIQKFGFIQRMKYETSVKLRRIKISKFGKSSRDKYDKVGGTFNG